MKNKNVVLKRLLSMVLLGTFAFSPVVMSSAAQAEPPRNAPAWGNRGNDHRGNRKENRTFTGAVTRVESQSKFKIRADGREYEVSLSKRAPRRLDRNDQVRVYGYLSRHNEIRDATVVVLNNRWGNNQPGERYQTFVGVVTKVKSDSEFDMRFDGKIYNVYLSEQTRHRLNRDDRVSVYGYRHGNNDIRKASVTVLGRR